MNTHNKALPAVNSNASSTEMQIAGANLKSVMERELARRQMSVSGLARDAHVQRGDIYRWWRGEQRPSRNSIARVAAALDVPPTMLSGVYGEAVVTAEQSPLVEALLAQTDAITALVDALRPLAALVDLEPRVRGLEAAVGLLTLQDAEGRQERSPHPTSTGSGR